MNWQEKLRTLIRLAEQGSPREDVTEGLRIGLSYSPGLTDVKIPVSGAQAAVDVMGSRWTL